MSNLTKKAMAAVLLEQLEETPPDRITVRSITDACGLTRNTFYYHFHDVYELLAWAFRDQADSIMSRHTENEDWQAGLEEALTFLYEHRKMVMHVQRSISFDTLISFVDEIVYHHAKGVVAREAESLAAAMEEPGAENSTSVPVTKLDAKSQSVAADEKAIALTADFYTNAMAGAVLAWIRRDMPETPGQLARLYNDMFQGTLEAALNSSAVALRWI